MLLRRWVQRQEGHLAGSILNGPALKDVQPFQAGLGNGFQLLSGVGLEDHPPEQTMEVIIRWRAKLTHLCTVTLCFPCRPVSRVGGATSDCYIRGVKVIEWAEDAVLCWHFSPPEGQGSRKAARQEPKAQGNNRQASRLTLQGVAKGWPKQHK